MHLLFILFGLFISFSALAAEKLKVSWDCSLGDDVVSCVDLRQAYFNNNALEDVTSASVNNSLVNADLSLIIRALPLSNEVEYQVTTKWKDSNELLFPGFRLNSNLSPGECLEKVLVFLKDVT